MLNKFLLLLFFSGDVLAAFAAPKPRPFMRTELREGKFFQNGKPYLAKGCNYWYGSLLAAQDDASSQQRLKSELDFLKKQGIQNLRVFVSFEGNQVSSYPYRVIPGIQTNPGLFSEKMMKGLDVLLHELWIRDMQAILVLGNNWEWSGGFGQYLEWAGVSGVLPKEAGWEWSSYCNWISKFYSNQECLDLYQQSVVYTVSRKSSVDGQPLNQHPAIFAWELANEPRPMDVSAREDYVKWVQSSSRLIKHIDSNHLVTIGVEGSIGTLQDLSLFEEIHAIRDIDFCTLHLWPKTWNWYQNHQEAINDTTLAKTESYIVQHVQAAQRLHKPLIIEEFGMQRDGHSLLFSSTTSQRDAYYKFVLNCVEKYKISGFHFWGFAGVPESVSGYLADPPQEERGLYSVSQNDASTWEVIRRYTQKKN